MNDLESRIRDAFLAREGDAPAFDPSDAHHVAGRTRRRQILNATVAGVASLAVVVAITAGLGGLVRADRTSLDSPSPSPSAQGFSTFSSAIHQITMEYPAGWQVRPATEPWNAGRLTFDASDVDVIFDPTRGDDLYLALVSKPLDGQSQGGWSDAPWPPWVCAGATFAGDGFINPDGVAMFSRSWSCGGGGSPASGYYLKADTDTRGYFIYLHVGDRGLHETYDVNFFNGLLETIELEYRDPNGSGS